MQIKRFETPVYSVIGNMEERALLSKGDTVHRPYRSNLVVNDYTRDTAVTIQSLSATDENLVVDTAKIIPFYIDDLDKIQNGYDTAMEFADDAGEKLENTIDAEFLAQYDNAGSTVDDGDIGGTDGNAIELTTSNVVSTMVQARRKLKANNVSLTRKPLFAVVGPQFMATILEAIEGKMTQLGDNTGVNGHLGKYMGFDIYESNNLTFTAKWTPADNPSNGGTISINGVTFTFVSSIGSTAGNVLIGGSTAATLDNLVALINDPSTTTANGVAFTGDSLAYVLNNLSATDNTTNITIESIGTSEITVATSVTADAWSEETTHNLFGQNGAIDIVVQENPNVEFKDVPDKLGKNVLPWTLFGLKTFAEGALALVDVQTNPNA